MRVFLALLLLILLTPTQLILAESLSEVRKEKARENIEQMKKAEEVTEADNADDDPQKEEVIHPYEELDPASRENLFEKMETEAAGAGSSDSTSSEK